MYENQPGDPAIQVGQPRGVIGLLDTCTCAGASRIPRTGAVSGIVGQRRCKGQRLELRGEGPAVYRRAADHDIGSRDAFQQPDGIMLLEATGLRQPVPWTAWRSRAGLTDIAAFDVTVGWERRYSFKQNQSKSAGISAALDGLPFQALNPNWAYSRSG